MSSHELNRRIPSAYPATPDLGASAPPPDSGGTQGVQPFAPIRSAAEYDSESDDDDELTHTATASQQKAHKSRPSAAGLLASQGSSADFAAGAGGSSARAGLSAGAQAAEAEQAKARRLEDYDAPVQPLLDENLTALQKVRAFVKLNEGFLLIALSQFFFASVNTCVKLLQEQVRMGVWQVVWIRMSVTFVGSYLMLRFSGDPHPFLGPPGIRLLLTLRGFVGFFGLIPGYYSLQFLDLSDSATLTFLSPGLVAILAYFLLKEPYSRQQAYASLLSLFGVVLISKPTFLFGAHEGSNQGGGREVSPAERTAGVASALLAALGAAGAYLIVRFIGKRCKPLHSVSYFSGMCVVATTLYALGSRSVPVWRMTREFWLLMLPIGVFGFCAQILLTAGLQRENAGRGTLAVYSNILFALILERVVFGTYPDFFSLLGSAIIIGSALHVALSKKADAPTPVAPKDLEVGAEAPEGLMNVPETAAEAEGSQRRREASGSRG